MATEEKSTSQYTSDADLQGSATERPDADEALAYLQTHHERSVTDEAALRAIRRKVDWRILPILSVITLMQSIDKFALNVYHSLYSRL